MSVNTIGYKLSFRRRLILCFFHTKKIMNQSQTRCVPQTLFSPEQGELSSGKVPRLTPVVFISSTTTAADICDVAAAFLVHGMVHRSIYPKYQVDG